MRFARTIALLLIVCLGFASTGYSITRMICPKKASACSVCAKHDKASAKAKSCCKVISQHEKVSVVSKTLTASFEKHQLWLIAILTSDPLLGQRGFLSTCSYPSYSPRPPTERAIESTV